MIWSFFLNGIVGFFVLIAFLFAMPDISAVQGAVSGSPFLFIFQQASYWGCMPLIVMIILVMITGSIDANASCSRQTFAFARDGGLPGASFLSRVSKVCTRNLDQIVMCYLSIYRVKLQPFPVTPFCSLASSLVFCPLSTSALPLHLMPLSPFN